jgi:hypothetical protein
VTERRGGGERPPGRLPARLIFTLATFVLGGCLVLAALVVLVANLLGVAFAGNGRWLALGLASVGLVVAAVPAARDRDREEFPHEHLLGRTAGAFLFSGLALFSFRRADLLSSPWWQWVAYALFAVAAALSVVATVFSMREEARRERESVTLIRRAFATSTEQEAVLSADRAGLAEELRQIERQIHDRRTTLAELTRELDRYRRRAEQQNAAYSSMMLGLRSTIAQEIEAMQRRSHRGQLMFFALGVIVSVPVGLLVNYLS